MADSLMLHAAMEFTAGSAIIVRVVLDYYTRLSGICL
jgi:hypothetical protein